MDNQQPIQNFLKELSEKLEKIFKKNLDFILLFGSAARGEWKKGVSDVDLIIQVKTQKDISNVKTYTDKIFWELDKKHKTELKKVCSTGDEKDKIKTLIKQTKLYVPYEVFGPKDIDWIKGKIKRKDLMLGAKLVASQAMLFTKMKKEGKILQGRDIRKIIKVKITLWEKFKAILIPFYISFCSILCVLFLPKISLKMSDKAIVYSLESTLFFLNKPFGKNIKDTFEKLKRETREKIRYRQNIFGAMEIDLALNFDFQKLLHLNFAKKAIWLKFNFEKESKKFNRIKALKFCWKAFFFINSINCYAIWKTEKDNIILKILFILRTILLILIIWLAIVYLF